MVSAGTPPLALAGLVMGPIIIKSAHAAANLVKFSFNLIGSSFSKRLRE
jgi:hypothetical protein